MSAMTSLMNRPEMTGLHNLDNIFTRFWGLFVMWAVMMIAMMVPSATRTVIIYARIVRNNSGMAVISPTYLFIGGYVMAWTGFSVFAALFQLHLEQLALLSPMMVSSSPLLGSSLLVLAGIYQLLPIKEACLHHCQSPFTFISENFRPGLSGALRMGLKHGLYCLGCCWALMMLLFVAGVMNLFWVLLITLFVLLEKLLGLIWPEATVWSSRVSSCGLIIAGLLFYFI